MFSDYVKEQIRKETMNSIPDDPRNILGGYGEMKSITVSRFTLIEILTW